MNQSGLGNRESGLAAREPARFPIPDSRLPFRLAFAAAALFLSACVSVFPDAAPASARFQVTDVEIAPLSAAPVEWTLGIEEPDATLAFNTAKVALTREPARIEYYAGGEWVDRAPRLFGAALVRSFENSGRITGVGARVSLPISDYALQTDIRKLTIAHNGELTAEAAIFARLTNGRSIIHASKLFTASEPVRADNAGAAATALNEALARIQRELIDWTIAEAERAAAAKQPAPAQ